MKKLLIIPIILITSISYAQNLSKEENEKQIKLLNDKIYSIQSENLALKKECNSLNLKLSGSISRLDAMEIIIKENTNTIKSAKVELGNKIIETRQSNESKISVVDNSLNKNSLYGIIGVLSTILFSGFLYLFLSKRQKSDKSHMIEELSKTKASIEESLIKEFDKQTGFMATQVQMIEQQKSKVQVAFSSEPDHSLALKVASEINLIERNVALMDPKTKGLKQLLASVGKLKDNLAANGYEMPELLKKQFHHGMKVIVTNSIVDENFDKDSEIITKILIPQVNYNDKMIQTAQVEVTVGC